MNHHPDIINISSIVENTHRFMTTDAVLPRLRIANKPLSQFSLSALKAYRDAHSDILPSLGVIKASGAKLALECVLLEIQRRESVAMADEYTPIATSMMMITEEVTQEIAAANDPASSKHRWPYALRKLFAVRLYRASVSSSDGKSVVLSRLDRRKGHEVSFYLEYGEKPSPKISVQVTVNNAVTRLKLGEFLTNYVNGDYDDWL